MTDLEMHIKAMKMQLKVVLGKDEQQCEYLKFAILAGEESLRLHREHRKQSVN